jgi:nitroimidazol reductase NimA-like FMN-containing flavoprotein (pyridoxamine 5'-phosphate oxidase superfamily)
MDDYMKQSLEKIAALFDSQRLGVLSTQNRSQPYASLVAFAAGETLKHLFFLTPNTTRKYENLITNPKVAILVNNSLNQADDIYKAVSVTAIGSAFAVDSSDKRDGLKVFLEKHPHLESFSKAPTTALVCVTVNRYFMVNQFQNVVEIKVAP